MEDVKLTPEVTAAIADDRRPDDAASAAANRLMMRMQREAWDCVVLVLTGLNTVNAGIGVEKVATVDDLRRALPALGAFVSRPEVPQELRNTFRRLRSVLREA
jgi:hypothetical protein